MDSLHFSFLMALPEIIYHVPLPLLSQLDTSWGHLERETPVKKLPPTDWPEDKPAGAFS